MVLEILSGLLIAALVTGTGLAVWVSILRDNNRRMRLTNNGLHEKLMDQVRDADEFSAAAERLLVRLAKIEEIISQDSTMSKTTKMRLITEIKK